jgi:hypothetical protein
MGDLKGRLRKLQEELTGKMITIPQRDGTVRRFPAGTDKEAFTNLMDRLGAGEDAPPEHPMLAAVRNSSDPGWRGTFYFMEDPDEVTRPVEDLSE